jgi:hypothetical protein
MSENAFMVVDKRMYEIRNFKDGKRSMFISFSLQHLYDNTNTIVKSIAQISTLIEETLFNNFKVQLDATYSLIQNYKVDFTKIQQYIQHKSFLEKENTELMAQLNKYTTRRSAIQAILDKSKGRVSDFEYQQLFSSYGKEIKNIQQSIDEGSEKILKNQTRQMYLYLKLDQIFYDNVKYLQFIRKNLTEMTQLFSSP